MNKYKKTNLKIYTTLGDFWIRDYQNFIFGQT